MTNWWIDELEFAGKEHLGEAYVRGYDRKAGFDPGEDISVLKAHGLDSASTLIDLGAGTGKFATAAARLCAAVIAVEPSPAMIKALRSTAEKAELANLAIVQGGFLSYEHGGDPVDFVYTRNALHQLPDFWKGLALERIHSLLRPGGIMLLKDLVFDFEPADANEKIEAWLAGAVDDSSVGWTSQELEEHVQKEFSTYSWLLEAMLERTGFEILERSFRRSAYGTYVCRACS